MSSTSCDTQFLKEMCFAIRTYSTNITSTHFHTPWSARTSTQTARVLLKGSVWLSKGNTEVTQAAGVLLGCFRGTFSLGVDTDVSVHFRIHIGLPKLLTCACWEALKIFPSPPWSAWIGCVCVSQCKYSSSGAVCVPLWPGLDCLWVAQPLTRVRMGNATT